MRSAAEYRGECFCTIGGRAATAWFVLTHLLGRDRVGVYDGSWAEWGRVPGHPRRPHLTDTALGTLKAEPQITEAFRTGAGMGWHEHDGVP